MIERVLQEPPDGPVLTTLAWSFATNPCACIVLIGVILVGIAMIRGAGQGVGE